MQKLNGEGRGFHQRVKSSIGGTFIRRFYGDISNLPYIFLEQRFVPPSPCDSYEYNHEKEEEEEVEQPTSCIYNGMIDGRRREEARM